MIHILVMEMMDVIMKKLIVLCVCVFAEGGGAPLRRNSRFRDVNSALGRRQLPPPQKPSAPHVARVPGY